jgi:hypothetical protein
MPAIIVPIVIRLGLYAIAISQGPRALRELYDTGAHIWDDVKRRRSSEA